MAKLQFLGGGLGGVGMMTLIGSLSQFPEGPWKILRHRPGKKKRNLGQIHLNEGCFFDVPGRKLGSMVRINGLFHLLVDGGIILGLQPIY